MSVCRNAGWPTFSADILRRLGEAVDVDDAVDAKVALPEPIVPGCSQSTMRECFAVCLQFWEDGFTREQLLSLILKLRRGEWLDTDECRRYKGIRARYKHLRFAQRLYGKQHKTSKRFDEVTRRLGRLQDAFRGRQHSAVVHQANKLRILLALPVWAIIRWQVRHTCLDSAAAFLAYQRQRLRWLKKAMAQTNFTGEEFHEIRKVVSEQVSFYDTLRTLESNEHAYKMSRFLAAINGLMGSRHDEMVAESLTGSRDYRTAAPLDEDTRWRLEMLISRYPGL